MQPRAFSQIEQGVDVERWTASTCGICSLGCGLEIGTANGRIVGVRGRIDDPVGRGRLGPKGLNQWYANGHSARALHPLIRSGDRLLRASWDDAMELVTAKFNEALALEGPDAVRRMQQIYAQPIRAELITERLREIRDAHDR